MKVNKLSDFGYAFQIKLIAALFKDKLFLQQISDILDSSYFESEANIIILDIIKDYYREYNSLPTISKCNETTDKATLPNEPLRNRLDPVMVDAYKENPYTHSLSSYAFN